MNQLHNLIESNQYSNIISWNISGESFAIHNKQLFIEIVLPKITDFPSYRSFLCNLNQYGFDKTETNDNIEFYHRNFKRGCAKLVPKIIKNKKPKPVNNDPSAIALEIDQIKSSIEIMETQMDLLTKQNNQMQEIFNFNYQQTIINATKIALISEVLDTIFSTTETVDETSSPKQKKQKTSHSPSTNTVSYIPILPKQHQSFSPTQNNHTLTIPVDIQDMLDNEWFNI